jgi:NADH-quinone oxidoreductase subunit C
MDDFGSAPLRALLGRMGDAVHETHAHRGDATATVDPQRILDVMRFLRDDNTTRFDMLTDLTAADYPTRDPRFEVVYHLYSIHHNHRLRIKATVPEVPCQIESLVELWASANWMEREVWDLYGIRFRNHPDLRRILLYEEFEGHPLRKDYAKEHRQPLVGPRN